MKNVIIKTYENESEAELAKSLLEKNGIKAIVVKTTESGISSFLTTLPSMLGGNKGKNYNLLVRDSDKQTALEIIQ